MPKLHSSANWESGQMSQRDVNQVVQQMESSNTSRDGHTHDFSKAYQQIVQMQNNDGGGQSQQFHQDMASVNQKLHADGLAPNLEIVGVDPKSHGLITQDRADHRTVVQDASAVNDFGALGSGKNPQEAALAFMAKAYGIDVSRNPDGSYDVKDPFANPANATDILNTFLHELTGVGNSNVANNKNNPGSQGPIPLGMNSWMSQAWTGW
jgi:hypothetical protein